MSISEDVEKIEALYIAGMNVKWYTLTKSLTISYKFKHKLPILLTYLTLEIFQKEITYIYIKNQCL